MASTFRGVLGLGVTLFVLAAGMATINGLVRAYASKRLAENSDDATAVALVMLF